MKTELRPCAGPLCPNLEDPRWGGYCDGCGVENTEQAVALKNRYRETNAVVRALLADVREHFRHYDPLEDDGHYPAAKRQHALLERINLILDGEAK